MRKVFGYVVVRPRIGPVGLGVTGSPDEEVLWGNRLTVFKNRKRARQAIKKTQEYADQHHYDWDQHSFYICRVDQWL